MGKEPRNAYTLIELFTLTENPMLRVLLKIKTVAAGAYSYLLDGYILLLKGHIHNNYTSKLLVINRAFTRVHLSAVA